MSVTNGCAEGGLPEDALNDNPAGDVQDAGSGSGSNKDAGKDARTATLDATTSTAAKEDAATATGGNKDAATGTGDNKDAATGTGTGPGAAIKCPSPMVCNTSLASILSILDSTIKSTDNLCSTTGGILPSAVSCTTVDTCKSSRLTTATCSGGSCIQPCTP